MRLFFCLVLLTSLVCSQNASSKARSYRALKDEPPLFLPTPGKPITIFIPGGAKPVSSLLKFPGFDDDCPPGFYLVQELGNATNCLGRKVAHTLARVDPQNFPLSSFYVFGWSSLLSLPEREKAGRQLYNHLKILRADERYKDVPITVIAYSHGGNVALSAAIAALEDNDHSSYIDRLVLMACPVVSHTEYFVGSPTFKHVIALFSKGDVFQTTDPQGIQPRTDPCFTPPFFSKRRFEANTSLIQAEVKINNRSRTGHLGFINKRVLRHLPKIITFLSQTSNQEKLQKGKDGAYCISINTRYHTIEECPKK